MATPALRTRLATPAETVRVLYTDEPEPHAPDLVLKTVPVASVTVHDDRTWTRGGDRLVEITLAEAEIAPNRRFDIDAGLSGATSARGTGGLVPAQFVDANVNLFFDADGRRFIPAPSAA